MRIIKTTTISILAVGLLAGSAVGVAAQDADPMAPSTFTIQRAGEPEGTTDPSGAIIVVGPVESTDQRLCAMPAARSATDTGRLAADPSMPSSVDAIMGRCHHRSMSSWVDAERPTVDTFRSRIRDAGGMGAARGLSDGVAVPDRAVG